VTQSRSRSRHSSRSTRAGRVTLAVFSTAMSIAFIASTASDVRAAGPLFQGLSPARLLDTRPGQPTIDGVSQASGPLGSDSTLTFQVSGRGGVPSSGAGAVAMNVTATDGTASSYLTVFPTGVSRPTASNLNFVAGQTIPNMVIVPIGDGGTVSVYNSNGSTDVVVDVLGWFADDGGFAGLVPARVLDTRAAHPTIDGRAQGAGPVGPASVLDLQISGRGGVPDVGVGAVALNVTATGATSNTYITAFPAGASRPTASNLNVTIGQTIPNMVIVPVGTSGMVSLYNNGGLIDLVVDVLGWFPLGGGFTAVNPYRVGDTRLNVGWNGDGYSAFPLDQLDWFSVTGSGGVPKTGVSAVALNVTVTEPTSASYVTVFPWGAIVPTASNLNFLPGQTIPNMVIVPVSPNGQITLLIPDGITHVVIDVLGYFTGTPYSRPPQNQFACSTASKTALANFLRVNRAGQTDFWGWNLFDIEFANPPALVVSSFDAETGTLVASTGGIDYVTTRAVRDKAEIGNLEEHFSWSGGGKFLTGDSAPIFASFWNTAATVTFTKTATSLTVKSCTVG